MCAQPNKTNIVTTSQTSAPKQTKGSSKPEPKWLTMKKQNKSSAGKTAKPTAKTGGAQKPNEQTRNQKRARWAKKSKPVVKAVVRKGPVFEYISDCCGIQCNKIRCGTKVATIDPETGKPAKKDKVTGLGTWRCNGVGGCKKYCSVTRKAPTAKENPYLTPAQKEGVAALPTIGGTVPDVVYPAKLHTPVVTEASTVANQ